MPLATDVEFLAALAIGEGAPAKLAAAAAEGDVVRFVERLQKWLPKSAKPVPASRVAWSRDSENELARTTELFDIRSALGKGKRKGKSKVELVDGMLHDGANGAVAAWLDAVPADEPPTPIERLLLGEMLLDCADTLSPRDIWRAWRAVVEPTPVELPENAPADERLVSVVELEWLIGTLAFAEDRRWRAAAELQRELLDQTDTDGTPSADIVPRLDRWLAPFVRTAPAAKGLDLGLLSEDGADRLHDFVLFAAATLRRDGTLPLGDRNVIDLLREAVAVTGWSPMSTVGSLVAEVGATASSRTNGKHPKSGKAAKKDGPKPRRPKAIDESPSMQSDWAHVAHMRSEWTAMGDSLLALHRGAETTIDLAVLGHTLLTGTWGLRVAIDGKAVEFDDGWEPVLWFTDEEVDYIELQFVVDDHTRIERQLLLPHGDRFAILADAVTTVDGATIDYESRLPLAEGIEARADVDTREATLHAKRRVARVFPLALPQDRMHSGNGWFGPDEGVLRLEQSSVGGLYAPVVLDWEPERAKSMVDWRTLTVTESGRLVGPETAAGARVRIGREQLLLYRSLKPSEVARAVLGLHTPRETVIGRVPDNGDIDALLLVDG